MRQQDELYRKKECELCGKHTFEKWLGTKAILDGGFTRVEDFEKSGFGSVIVIFDGIESVNDSRIELKLCPDCAKEIMLSIAKPIAELKKKYTDATDTNVGNK